MPYYHAPGCPHSRRGMSVYGQSTYDQPFYSQSTYDQPLYGQSIYDRPYQPPKSWSVSYHRTVGVKDGEFYSETKVDADVGEDRARHQSSGPYGGSRATIGPSTYGSRYGGGSRATYTSHAPSRTIEPRPSRYSQSGRSHYEASRISVDTNSLPDGPRTRGPRPQFHDNQARSGAPNPGVEDWISKSQAPPRRAPPSAYRGPVGAPPRGGPPTAYRGPGGQSRAAGRGGSRGEMPLVPHQGSRFRSADARGGGRTVRPADSISQVSRRSRR